MLRIYMPIAFFFLFVGWILYRLVIKKDLKKNLNSLYLGLFFIGAWVLIYFFMLKS